MKIVLLIGLVVLTILTIDNYLFWYICVTKNTYDCILVTREELYEIQRKCEYVDVFPNHLHGIDNIGFLYGRKVVS